MVHNYNTCQVWSTIVRPGVSSLWYTTTIHVKFDVWSTIVRPGVYLLCGTQLQYMSSMVNHSIFSVVHNYNTCQVWSTMVSSLWYTTTIHVKVNQGCIFSVVHNYNTCQVWSTIVRPGVYLLCGTQLQYMSNMVNHGIFSVVHNYNTCQIWSTIVRPGVYLLCGTQLQYMSSMVNHSIFSVVHNYNTCQVWSTIVSSLWYTTTIHVKFDQP